jgi:hypothetical protein
MGKLITLKFAIFMIVTAKSTVFRDVMSCRWKEIYRLVEEHCAFIFRVEDQMEARGQ